MKSVIAIIDKLNFKESDFDKIFKDTFTEFKHGNVEYLKVRTFESYIMQNPFEFVFTTEEFEEWLTEVPASITKLQAIKQLFILGKYTDLLAALNKDDSGESYILFEAAHRLDRNSNMVTSIGLALDIDNDGLDEFFINASKIVV